MAHETGPDQAHQESQPAKPQQPRWLEWVHPRFRSGPDAINAREVNTYKALARSKLEPAWWNLRKELATNGPLTYWGAYKLICAVLYELAGRPDATDDRSER